MAQRSILVFILVVLGTVALPSGLADAERKVKVSKAVERAMDWLARHQKPDGSWASHAFGVRCKDKDKICANEALCYTDGQGFEGYDEGVTALAVRVFVEAGNTHQEGRYKDNVARAVDYLLSHQTLEELPKDGKRKASSDHGRLSKSKAEEWIYNHILSGMALARLLEKSGDKEKLAVAVTAATDYSLRARNEGYGWKYKPRGGRNDTSVTSWMVEFLHVVNRCREAKLIEVDKKAMQDAMKGAISWLVRVTSQVSGIVGYLSPGDTGAHLMKVFPEPYPYEKKGACMSAAALNAYAIAGAPITTDEHLSKTLALVQKNMPQWKPAKGKQKSKINFYYWYHGTQALSRIEGSKWKKWKKTVRKILNYNQRKSGCEAGSWDTLGEWSAAGGRVYTTAIGALILLKAS